MSGVDGCDKHPDRIIDCCVECLKLAHADCLETIKAMLFAARGDECDLATLEREMNAVSTKPSEYIRHIVSGKDRQLAEARAEIERLKLTTGELTGAFNARPKCEKCERKDQLIEQMREALRLALPEARSTHCENTIKAALAAERGE